VTTDILERVGPEGDRERLLRRIRRFWIALGSEHTSDIRFERDVGDTAVGDCADPNGAPAAGGDRHGLGHIELLRRAQVEERSRLAVARERGIRCSILIRWKSKSGNNTHQRGFPSTVLSNQTIYSTGFQSHRHTLQNIDTMIGFRKAICFQNMFFHFLTCPFYKLSIKSKGLEKVKR
jgi:hypothetical protein